MHRHPQLLLHFHMNHMPSRHQQNLQDEQGMGLLGVVWSLHVGSHWSYHIDHEPVEWKLFNVYKFYCKKFCADVFIASYEYPDCAPFNVTAHIYSGLCLAVCSCICIFTWRSCRSFKVTTHFVYSVLCSPQTMEERNTMSV